ncbi:sugar ABC transporter ATP-binding protein [Actinomadura sp. NAK00032]|nr:sugar ABC transporter ATP-binding protein [Actinomadura sp. NAK00032]
MVGITKAFPGVQALSGVDLEVRRGEVHCLLGQNGAGKSTLIKVLAGVHRPDGGVIRVEGRELEFRSPVAASSAGIATIYQELDLVDGLSVAGNVFLGQEIAAWGVTRRQRQNRQAAELLARLGHPDIDPAEPAGGLAPAGQQIVSMARALSRSAKIIVMDEPSAALSHDEVANLFRIIRELRSDGVGVIYISHRLEEIREIGDRITVLKDGRTVGADLDAKTTSTEEVVTLMSGRAVERAFPERAAGPGDGGAPVLEVAGLSRRHEFEDVSFAVAAGEVVGIAGLVGSGRSEILETIFGARKAARGRVSVGGEPLKPGSIAAAMRAGVGLAPEERKSQALALGESVARNMSLSSLARVSRLGWLQLDKELEQGSAYGSKLDLRPADPRVPVRRLSGGNQQKVVLARWLIYGCRVLLLDEPTRGVDAAARAEIYGLVRELADQGLAVVVVSSEIAEVIGLADRVLVLREGRLISDVPAADITEQQVLDTVMEGNVTVELDGVAR